MVTVCTCARPCVIATMFSERVSTQRDRAVRAGAPASATSACSTSAPNFAPNAPPTAGVMTRTCSGGSPSILASEALRALRALVRAATRQPAVAAPCRRAGAYLQRRHRDALVEDLARDHDLAVGEDVGSSGSSPPMSTMFVPAPGTAASRRARRVLRIDDRRQRVVLDVDQLRGVLALVAAVGEHHRDRLADEARPCRRPAAAAPSRPGTSATAVSGSAASARSSAVNTATQPSSRSAAEVSIATIRACAIGERTTVMRNAPASRSSTRSSV